MRRDTFAEMPCSLTRTLAVVGDAWTPLVIRDIAFGISRFDAIERNLGLSRKVLSQRLASLLEQGIITRTPYQQGPVRYDYSLTEKGNDLALVLAAMQAFGDKWDAPKGPPVRWRHLACGAHATVALTCSECGGALEVGGALPEKGPGFVEGAFPEISRVLDELADAAG